MKNNHEMFMKKRGAAPLVIIKTHQKSHIKKPFFKWKTPHPHKILEILMSKLCIGKSTANFFSEFADAANSRQISANWQEYTFTRSKFAKLWFWVYKVLLDGRPPNLPWGPQICGALLYGNLAFARKFAYAPWSKTPF